ncbi:MAG: DUF4199 domain-containing protein [Opitutaceae bacterium]|nr:DUF4199 domain-containing protein [Opitutaceae bacterium]
MKTPLTYGFLMALGGALLTLVLFFAGFHDSPEKMKTAQGIGIVVGLAITITCLSLAMREKRANLPPDADWGYGSAFGVGVLTAIVSAAFGTLFAYLYFGVINPGFSDMILQVQLEKMEGARMSAAQIERAEPMLRKWVSPIALTITQCIMAVIGGAILSLIVAIFHRRPPVPPIPVSAPTPV